MYMDIHETLEGQLEKGEKTGVDVKEHDMSGIRMCVNKAGGQNTLAYLLGLTPSAVYQWCRGLRRPSAQQCLMLERSLGVRVERIRPELPWVRFKDARWPVLGKPYLDFEKI